MSTRNGGRHAAFLKGAQPEFGVVEPHLVEGSDIRRREECVRCRGERRREVKRLEIGERREGVVDDRGGSGEEVSGVVEGKGLEGCEEFCSVDCGTTRCWGVTTLTSNEGEGTVTVATRARWRVVSVGAASVLLARDGEFWYDEVEGAGEGSDIAARFAPP